MSISRHMVETVFGGALRRWIAVLCVSLFVFSGYAHSACFVEAAAPAHVVQITNDLSGDTSDDPTTSSADGAHCHGCTVAAMPMDSQALSFSALVWKPVAALTEELSATDRQFEPPPPKA